MKSLLESILSKKGTHIAKNSYRARALAVGEKILDFIKEQGYKYNWTTDEYKQDRYFNKEFPRDEFKNSMLKQIADQMIDIYNEFGFETSSAIKGPGQMYSMNVMDKEHLGPHTLSNGQDFYVPHFHIYSSNFTKDKVKMTRISILLNTFNNDLKEPLTDYIHEIFKGTSGTGCYIMNI